MGMTYGAVGARWLLALLLITVFGGVLPMGSLFEAAQLVLFDLVSIMLREKTGQAAGEMSARHTNLE